MDTIGESISLVNTGENLVGKDSLDRGYSLCYMQREFYSNMMMGSVSDSSLLQVPVPLLPAECVSVLFSISYSNKTWVQALRNYTSLLTKGGVREDKRYGQVVQ